MGVHQGVLERAAERQAKGEAFALATVVRTVSVTAAKAGAKALIGPDGVIEEGWIGGGCARAAVVKAAKQCLVDGRSRLVSIAPKEGLDELGVAPGEDKNGVLFAKNSCPSQGTMDIFVEPVLPKPRLLILGASPVAVALASLAPTFGFAVAVAAQPGDLEPLSGRRAASRRRRAARERGRRRLCRRVDPRRGGPRRAQSRGRDVRALSRLRRLAPQGGYVATRTCRRGRRRGRRSRRSRRPPASTSLRSPPKRSRFPFSPKWSPRVAAPSVRKRRPQPKEFYCHDRALPLPCVARAKKPAVVAALALALALSVLPDCCLNGSHAYGFGMDTFASVCHARR